MAVQNVIPVFFSVDDRYASYLAVAVESIKENASSKYKYEINVMVDKISDEVKKTISQMQTENISIEFVNINRKFAALSDKVSLRDYYSIATYFRFFIPHMFPQYDYGIYLDCDIVLEADVAELYFAGKKNTMLAAMTDEVVTEIDIFGEYTEKVLSIPPREYFNAGVLVMNLKKMRNEKLLEAFLDMLPKRAFPVAQDQDYMNVLCHGDVTYLDIAWNKTPFPQTRIDSPKLIHFKLSYRPWRYSGVCYEESFWKYAKNTEYYESLVEEKNNFSEADAAVDKSHGDHLAQLAIEETEKAKEAGYISPISFALAGREPEPQDPHKEREKILAKIEEYERLGLFDVDVENDPPARALKEGECDFMRTKLKSRIKTGFANNLARMHFDGLIKKSELCIKEIRGIDNYLQLKDKGVIITSNHFHPYEQYAIYKAIQPYLGKKNLFKVIREGNFTGMTGLYGFFFRNCNTLPIGTKVRVWREFSDAVSKLLKQNEKILIYPEQSMWWNYQKPRPLKPGAFRFAAKENVPVLPIFITMEDTDKQDGEGYPIKAYTMHFLPAIYPTEGLSVKENAREMAIKNYEAWKKVYEETYKKPLVYTTESEVLPCYM